MDLRKLFYDCQAAKFCYEREVAYLRYRLSFFVANFLMPILYISYDYITKERE